MDAAGKGHLSFFGRTQCAGMQFSRNARRGAAGIPGPPRLFVWTAACLLAVRITQVRKPFFSALTFVYA
jgi:hypothetical protein